MKSQPFLMKTNFIILLLAFVLVSFSEKKPHSKAIDVLLLKEMRELQIPGMTAAVVQDGKLLHLGSYGTANIEWNQPVTKSTTFQIASVTKLFTSTLVMKFIQEGKINLDDPIIKFFPDAPATWSDIRVKHLLSHQSGIPWPASIGGFLGTRASTSDKPATKEQVYNDMRDSALTYQPGSKESYINGDAFIMQMILEKIGGEDITELFRHQIFGPLGMNNTGFDREIRNFPGQVMQPLKNKSQIFTKGKNGPLIFKSFYNPTSYCSGGLYMSVEDAVKWATALDKGEFLKQAIVDQLTSKMPLNGSFTALGWNHENFNGHDGYGHSGGPGLGDILRFPEKKLTIIVFTNYADMYPYLAASIGKLYFPDIELKGITKTLDRGYEKMY
jgi:CubicO group peptidase (beta-lactamase class C family)